MTRISRIFLKGLIATFPILITVYLLTWVASRIDEIFSQPLKNWFPDFFSFPGLGLMIIIVLIFAVGLLVNSYFTQPLMTWIEAQISRLPIVKSIYNPLKDLTQMFAHPQSGMGQQSRAVLVHLPGLGGLQALGLITRDHFEDLPGSAIAPGTVAVFIPFSYGIGGYTVLVPKSQTHEIGIPAERALQLALTGWVKTSGARE
jgi:uncharacterized membrane protein